MILEDAFLLTHTCREVGPVQQLLDPKRPKLLHKLLRFRYCLKKCDPEKKHLGYMNETIPVVNKDVAACFSPALHPECRLTLPGFAVEAIMRCSPPSNARAKSERVLLRVDLIGGGCVRRRVLMLLSRNMRRECKALK